VSSEILESYKGNGKKRVSKVSQFSLSSQNKPRMALVDFSLKKKKKRKEKKKKLTTSCYEKYKFSKQNIISVK